jgi:protein-tyrosine-phosphatase
MNKKILFLCKGNWFRSQMAEAIYNKITNTQNADSAGTNVGLLKEPEAKMLGELFPTEDFFNVMEENGYGDLKNNTTKSFESFNINDYDLIVCMAEEPYIPDVLKNNEKVIFWNVYNPNFVDRKQAEESFGKIYNLVVDLINHGDVA